VRNVTALAAVTFPREAEDAVQDSWLRLSRIDADSIDDLRAWLTTVVGRICLDVLKARQARREDQVGTRFPEPLLAEPAAESPEERAVIAESIGLALLIVLESLTPPERLAFVLHDVFAVPFEAIGQIMGRVKSLRLGLQVAPVARVAVQPQAGQVTQVSSPSSGGQTSMPAPHPPHCMSMSLAGP
jgi:RNA polymerase sigma factor (sigma-70 family)